MCAYRHDRERQAAATRAALRPLAGVAGPSASGAGLRGLGVLGAVGNRAVAGLARDRFSALADVLRSPGRGLDPGVRAEFEALLGHDLGDVRLHTGSDAHDSAREMGARAYTVGADVVAQRGVLDPGTEAGRRALAHELVHVVQQRQGPVAGVPLSGDLRVSRPGDHFEQEADATARTVAGRERKRRGPGGVARGWRPGSPGVGPRRRAGERGPVTVQGDWLETAGDWVAAAGRGIVSVGEDLVGGVARTARGLNVFDPDELARIGAENQRAAGLLVSLVRERDKLAELSDLLVEHFYESLPEDRKAAVRAALIRKGIVASGYAVGRLVIGSGIAKAAARRIVLRLASTEAFKQLAAKVGLSGGTAATGVGVVVTLLMLQGVLERASRASRRLQGQHPELHRRLVAHDLDMAWFLVEPAYDELRREFEESLQRELGTDLEPPSPSPMGDYPLPPEDRVPV